jgi:hypothetical protein
MLRIPCRSPKFAVLALSCLSGLLGLSTSAPAQLARATTPATTQRGPARDAVTEEELRKRVEGTPKFEKVMAQKTRPVGEVRPAPQSSLLTSSIFLSDGATFTIVPVGAVLNLPPAHRGRVIAKPQGEFILWPTFLKNNSSWLAAREVPLKLAKGDADMQKAVLRQTSMDHRVVVSVYKGGPITILEAPPEAAGSAKSSAASVDSDGANLKTKP